MKRESGTKTRVGLVALVLSCLFPLAPAQEKTVTKDWPVAEPAAVGLDSAALTTLDADIAAGKYGLVDSLSIIRDGKQVLARSYPHDYGKIYGELAKHEGPLNHDVNGPYNYFSAESHPYYQHSDFTRSRTWMNASAASPYVIF